MVYESEASQLKLAGLMAVTTFLWWRHYSLLAQAVLQPGVEEVLPTDINTNAYTNAEHPYSVPIPIPTPIPFSWQPNQASTDASGAGDRPYYLISLSENVPIDSTCATEQEIQVLQVEASRALDPSDRSQARPLGP